MNRSIFGAVAAVSLVAGISGTALSDGHGKKESGHGMNMPAKTVTVDAGWARATPGMARSGGAYLTIANAGAQPDRVVGAKSDVARRTEIHTNINDDGVMKMRRVDGIDVPPGGSVTFKPGGYHVMFMGLDKPLKEGDKFPLTLTFEKAGDVTVEIEVKAIGYMGGGHGGHGAGMKSDMEDVRESMPGGMDGHKR